MQKFTKTEISWMAIEFEKQAALRPATNRMGQKML